VSILTAIVRRTGLRPLVSWAVDALGFSLIPKGQDPNKTWLGLRQLPIDFILDIGACKGGYARDIAAPNFPNAIIHSFEPSPQVFQELALVASKSGGKIIAHNVGLGNEAGRLPFNNVVDFVYSSSLLPLTSEGLKNFPQLKNVDQIFVDVVTLDEFSANLIPCLAGAILVKMDVQGFEDRVIAGGRSTISKSLACIVEISVAELYKGSPTFDEIYRSLYELGFVYVGNLEQYCDEFGNPIYFDAVFINEKLKLGVTG
jgi:FkbM family methyltransferase